MKDQVMGLLGYDANELETAGGLWTAREIQQQADMLIKTSRKLAAQRKEIDAFIGDFLTKTDGRIILTGAGTSAFIGQSIALHLTRTHGHAFEAIPTTDIVSAPHYYLTSDRPTLIVSFGRSGNSPESLAAIDIANQIIADVNHLIITCNSEGSLFRRGQGDQRYCHVLLPEETHDRSFAMTSSFTSMIEAALACFPGETDIDARIRDTAQATRHITTSYPAMMKALAERDMERIVYLGSHGFQGLAQECALKMLELTDGQTIAVHDTPMGFRHGPKTIINANTLVFVFVSNDPYTRTYDLDLIQELVSDEVATVIAIATAPVSCLDADSQILLPKMQDAQDVDLLVPYVVCPQILAFYQSLRQNRTPDSPDPSGRVNRVVKGVRIHPLPQHLLLSTSQGN